MTEGFKEKEEWDANYSWVAMDYHGYLGYFSSEYNGPIPELFSSNIDLLDDTYEDILKLPVVSKTTQKQNVNFNTYHWLLASERGFYSFIWDSSLVSYKLIIVPHNPVKISMIDTDDQEIFNKVKFNCSFKQEWAKDELTEIINF